MTWRKPKAMGKGPRRFVPGYRPGVLSPVIGIMLLLFGVLWLIHPGWLLRAGI